MSLFEYHRPGQIDPSHTALSKLRETLDGLEDEREETPQIAELRRILAGRIAELERKTA
jgi:hypothetical protein